MAKIVFKKENSKQLILLPPDLGSLIPENHLVRVVDKVINQLNLSPLFDTYQGGGTSSYHPRIMLKVLIYAYIEKIYTTRGIEKALRENINFMWLSGMSTPDHGTIHNFRASRMKEAVEDVFGSVIEVLIESGYVKRENLFVDGTKIEANANRYSYIWKKNVERYELSVRQKIKELLTHIELLQQQEDAEYNGHNLEEVEGNLSSEKVEKLIENINSKLSEGKKSRKSSAVITKLKNKYIPRLKQYEQQKQILQGRNSCSKTDMDATFFRMKEDHLGTGQLKPAYNVQIATENQFILGYGLYQKAADSTVFIPFMKRLNFFLKGNPENIVGDAGYGCQENYEYINGIGIGNYLKYNNFDYEKSSSHKKKIFLSDHFTYDKDNDKYICPGNHILDYEYTKKVTSETGYESERKVYRARDCSECKFRSGCCKGVKDRCIETSPRLNELKKLARKNLESDIGKELRSKRGVEVESVFGHVKSNRLFRRFLTRGLENVSTEWGIISIAHDIKKMAG
jgi:transposase